MAEPTRVQIRISDDALEAWVSVGAGEPVEAQAIASTLDASGVVHGIEEDELGVLERALALEQALDRDVRIARGTAPTATTPARLVLEEPEGPVPGILREDGSMDFRERRLLVPLEEDEIVAQVLPEEAGKPGVSVLGTEIPPEDPPAPTFSLGDGVRLEEGGVVRAARAGARALDDKGLLDVLDLHTHPGSVDLTSGHLETEGHLEVARDVMATLRVTAGGTIRIGGNVDGGRVEAGLDCEIVGGAIGREDGLVRARGDLSVRHALGVRLYAMGRIEVARSVSTSRLHAREVEIGGRALSDRIEAEERIVVQEAGSPSGGPCHLHVGVPLKTEEFELKARPKRIRAASRSVREGRKSGGGGARTRRNRGARRRNAVTASGVLSDDDVNARIEWRRKQRALLANATIEIQKVAYGGCCLHFGHIQRVIESNEGPCTYRLDPERGEIIAVQ